MSKLANLYDGEFYDENEPGSYRSAKGVLGLIYETLKPRSVLDIGCGVGTWLRAAIELGAEQTHGVDGPHVDRGRLLIPPYAFSAVDLNDIPALARTIDDRRFDLAMCLEVAEHLYATSARDLVQVLSRTADIILWSAAPPGQGGTHHINEQPVAYWASLWFAAGFAPVDMLRPGLQTTNVDVWYVQNAMLFVRKPLAAWVSQAFQDVYTKKIGYVPPLGFLHPRVLWRWLAFSPAALSQRLNEFAACYGEHLRRELGAFGDAIQRTDYVFDGNIGSVSFAPAGPPDARAMALLFSTDQMSLSCGLYFPVWMASDAETASARASAEQAGLSWDDPMGWRIEGWIEIGAPALRPLLSVSLLDGPPHESSARALAKDFQEIWSRFRDGCARLPPTALPE